MLEVGVINSIGRVSSLTRTESSIWVTLSRQQLADGRKVRHLLTLFMVDVCWLWNCKRPWTHLPTNGLRSCLVLNPPKNTAFYSTIVQYKATYDCDEYLPHPLRPPLLCQTRRIHMASMVLWPIRSSETIEWQQMWGILQGGGRICSTWQFV